MFAGFLPVKILTDQHIVLSSSRSHVGRRSEQQFGCTFECGDLCGKYIVFTKLWISFLSLHYKLGGLKQHIYTVSEFL